MLHGIIICKWKLDLHREAENQRTELSAQLCYATKNKEIGKFQEFFHIILILDDPEHAKNGKYKLAFCGLGSQVGCKQSILQCQVKIECQFFYFAYEEDFISWWLIFVVASHFLQIYLHF